VFGLVGLSYVRSLADPSQINIYGPPKLDEYLPEPVVSTSIPICPIPSPSIYRRAIGVILWRSRIYCLAAIISDYRLWLPSRRKDCRTLLMLKKAKALQFLQVSFYMVSQSGGTCSAAWWRQINGADLWGNRSGTQKMKAYRTGHSMMAQRNSLKMLTFSFTANFCPPGCRTCLKRFHWPQIVGSA